MKIFSLEAVLSVTTGRLLTKAKGKSNNGIGDIYDLLSFMCGEDVYTHQLGRFADECRSYILRQYPQLAIAKEKLTTLDVLLSQHSNPREACAEFIAWLKKEFELLPQYELRPIPKDDHTTIDPRQELEEMVGKEKVISINLPEND